MSTRALVGSPVGTMSARPTSGTTLSPSGDGTDFAIGGMSFKLAITDQRPYERATAQFRKEQFDATPTPGDQSLTGWWTRGQLSFHKGAGVKFYEVLDGEEILNRFNVSESLDVRTPGVVSLLPEGQLVNSSHLLNMATSRGRSEPIAAVRSDDAAVLIDGSTTTVLAPSTAGAVYAVASSPQQTFFATDNGIERVPDSGTTLTLVSAKDAVANVGVWWAKNRIWTVNKSGDWHTLPASGGAQGSATKTWASGLSSIRGAWSFASGPAAVYLSKGSLVYAITLADDGTVPVVQSGVTVAEVPDDETIQGMTYALGHIVLATTKGVRVAVVDGTNVVLGPLVVEGNFTTVVADGTTVFAASSMVGTAGVYAIDLTQPIAGTDLRFSWFKWTSTFGRIASAKAGKYVFSSSGMYSLPATGNLVTSGTLTTGYHRFGTLEPKTFHALKVRMGGTGGQIKIFRVMLDGSEVLLYTLNAASASNEDITLGMPDTAEAIALRFELERSTTDASKGPELLGYQLKALPSPRRQRMIRVPLLLHDVEDRAPARSQGRNRRAWERLRSLEEMEEAGAMQVFQDFRTGESGVCFIESVEHAGSTPPGKQDSGFGGVVVLTLRKVDS
jgi:hypothetical protein